MTTISSVAPTVPLPPPVSSPPPPPAPDVSSSAPTQSSGTYTTVANANASTVIGTNVDITA